MNGTSGPTGAIDRGDADVGPARSRTAASTTSWWPAVTFVLLAYAASWALWMAHLAPHLGDLLTADRTPADVSAYVPERDILLGMLGPALAALVMRIVITREGLRGSLGPVRDWRRLLIALVAPALFVAAVLLLVQALRFGRFSWYDESLLGYLLTMVIVFFNIPWGFGEEYGWRGYLLPKLLGLGEVKAGLIVGLVWAPWHFPVVLAGHAFPNQPPVRALLLFTVSVVLFSLILTRLWVWSGGSLLAVILAHMSVNLYAGYLEPPYLTGNPLLVNMGGAVSLTLATVLVVALYRRRRGTDTDTSVDTTVNTRATEG